MTDRSENFFDETDNLTTKDEPTLEDDIFMPLDEYQVSMEDAFTEEIDIKWNENVDDESTKNNNSESQDVITLKNITSGDLQQNSQQSQFKNILQASSNLAVNTACSHSDKVSTSPETLGSHLEVSEDHNYACDKNPSVTRDESGSNCHKSQHTTMECSKCSQVFQDAKSFYLHYRYSCGTSNGTYSCEKCAYKCNQISELEHHAKLMHHITPQFVRLKKKTFPPKKVKDSISQPIIVVSAKSLYSEHFNNVDEDDDFASFSPPKVHSNSVKQNSTVNSLPSDGQNDIAGNMVVNPLLSKNYNEDYCEKEKRIAKTVKQGNNHRDNNNKNAKVTKICQECNITTKLDTINNCNTCKEKCIFRCNQCSRHFENYQEVSQHLQTQCNVKGHYQCLECDFTSPFMYKVRNHCNQRHPQFFDPSGSVKNARRVFRYVEYRDTQNIIPRVGGNVDAGDIPTNILLPKNVAVPKLIVRHCVECKKDITLDSHLPVRKGFCKNCNNAMYFKCAKCSKFCRSYWDACQHSKKSVCSQKASDKCTKTDVANSKPTKHHQKVPAGYFATCQHCNKTFNIQRNYKRHILYCVKPLALKCENCSFRTKTKIGLRNHILTTHVNLQSNGVDFLLKSFTDRFHALRGCLRGYCEDCDVHSSMDLRVKKCRKCEKPLHFFCRICHKTFEGDDAKACEHVKAYLTLLNFECRCCGKGFSSEKKLHLHMTSCGTTVYKCRFCTEVFNWKLQLRRHEEGMHQKRANKPDVIVPPKSKVYQCNVCSRKFVGRISDLRKHILKCHMKGEDVSNVPPCTRCGWDFQSCFGMRKHLACCGKKLYMQCRVTLTRLNVERSVGSSEDLPPTMKEESVDLNECEMKFESSELF